MTFGDRTRRPTAHNNYERIFDITVAIKLVHYWHDECFIGRSFAQAVYDCPFCS